MKRINKKLHKLYEGRMLCGVCNGIADYFNIDVTLVRVGWILISLAGGSGLIAYILCALVMPSN